MRKLLKVIMAAVLVTTAVSAQAQKFGLKTNLLYWPTGTINLGAEIALGPKTTLDLTATGNPFYFGDKEKNRKIWHWTAQPEIRFWQCERFNRGFIGIHPTFGSFDAGGIDLPLGIFPGLKDHRFEGWLAGLGVSYGWQWYLGPHWNLEAVLGFGYLYMEYDSFSCAACSNKLSDNNVKHYFGPTKIGLSFIYLFRSKK